ncbi:MAG: hypothetical protein EOM19_07805 [Candidatus Moranbacteria bacterium]|nr:hypothetical protein [Candidatus Moranbacteria bacterium]
MPVFVISQDNFNWLTFFLGGAVGSFFGALIILSIERFWLFYEEKRKKKIKLKKASHSLTMENTLNYMYCYSIIKKIEEEPDNILGFKFIHLETFWLNTFRYNFLDSYNDDHTQVLFLINNIEVTIEIIKTKHEWIADYKNYLFYKYSAEEFDISKRVLINMDESLIPVLRRLMKEILMLESQRILNIHIPKNVADKTGFSKIIKKYFDDIIQLVDNNKESSPKESASKSSRNK